MKIYNLEVRITDNSPNTADRRSVITRVDVRVTNINDSGNYNAVVRMIEPRIAPTGSVVARTGIPSSSPIEIAVVDEKGVKTIITKETLKYTLDSSTKSNDLFATTVINGVPRVQANNEGKTGKGKLIVHVKDVYAVEIEVSVVGISSLVLQIAPYPPRTGSPGVAKLKQIVSGKYQQILLQTFVSLTDGYFQDVSTLENTSFVVTNAADFLGAFKFGPSPKNVFTLTSSGKSPFICLKSSFEGYKSNVSNLTVSRDVLSVKNILKVGFLEYLEGQNSTLSGPAVKTKVYPYTELKMDDNSILRVENFTYYSGLITFNLSSTSAAQITLPSGEVTLLGNDNKPVRFSAMSVTNTSISNVFLFYCNPEPDDGEVDIGESDGPAVPSLEIGQSWTMNITVNPGTNGLFALDVNIVFNTDHLELVSIVTQFPLEFRNNNIRLFGPVLKENALVERLAIVVFVSKLAGVPDIHLTSFTTVDQHLAVRLTWHPSFFCLCDVFFDFNLVCTFDIVDVAFIQGYSSSSKNGFKGSIGESMNALQENEKAMDFNWNQEVGLDDAILLSEIFLGHAKFISDMVISAPDHNSSPLKCSLDLKVKLKNKDGSLVSSVDTSIYFDIAHIDAPSQTQFDQTSFDAGSKISKKGISSRSGGIVKSTYTGNDGFYKVSATTSNLESEENFGITLIQVVTDSNQKKSVVALFSAKSSPIYAGKLYLELENGAYLDAPNGYSPQRFVSIKESTASCNDPKQITKIEVIFDADYSDIVLGREEQAKAECLKAFNSLYNEASFTNVHLKEGSVIATMDMTVQRSKQETVLSKIVDDVKNGLEITMNNKKVVTYPSMKVDGKDYIDQESTEAEPGWCY